MSCMVGGMWYTARMGAGLFYKRHRRRVENSRERHVSVPKTAKQMERHVKGIANHRRIDILFLIANEEGMSVEEISERLQCNFKTISEHTRRLVHAGLIDKKYKGRTVLQSLSPYGKIFVSFLTTFQHS